MIVAWWVGGVSGGLDLVTPWLSGEQRRKQRAPSTGTAKKSKKVGKSKKTKKVAHEMTAILFLQPHQGEKNEGESAYVRPAMRAEGAAEQLRERDRVWFAGAASACGVVAMAWRCVRGLGIWATRGAKFSTRLWQCAFVQS